MIQKEQHYYCDHFQNYFFSVDKQTQPIKIHLNLKGTAHLK